MKYFFGMLLLISLKTQAFEVPFCNEELKSAFNMQEELFHSQVEGLLSRTEERVLKLALDGVIELAVTEKNCHLMRTDLAKIEELKNNFESN